MGAARRARAGAGALSAGKAGDAGRGTETSMCGGRPQASIGVKGGKHRRRDRRHPGRRVDGERRR